MWNCDEDVNECGEPIELYLPVQAPPRKTNTAPQDSHIGGHHCFDDNFTPSCDVCDDKMFLMAQLRLQNASSGFLEDRFERFICAFSCPKEECFGQLVYQQGFSTKGGHGVFKCIEKRVPLISNENKVKPNIPVAVNKSSWYDDNDDGNDDDEWGMGDDDDVNLENAVAAMESKLDEGGALVMDSRKTAKKPHASLAPSSSEDSLSAFGCFLLKKQNEPRSTKSFLEDEDDVGLSESDEKIRNMLARYMAEEEDEDILAAIGGTNATGGGSGPTEEDERLSAEDRVLRGFQDRMRRAPRQVIRYANGGKPLWSIPDVNHNVPNCPLCGAERTFEMQVLPSILDALGVEKYETKTKREAGDEPLALGDLLSNGLNFGSIAAYTCSNPACTPEKKEAYLVIQKSVDDLPENGNTKKICGDNLSTPTVAVVEDLDDDAEFELDA
ncbi:unnamed protein product [Pseudo-nitzschia multistriata]|uniref:Programmed cell death protein 2 C-terminal domain-containing protein n=1 Tax=Pseudo-nitzschia multistriata TaxID=183589 RepID=A0A448ZAX0_9STRA|nr:unnamed protein product [Pseudo-nitzschia multistriata]